MSLTVEYRTRFDAAGKLDADDWLVIPRAQLREGFTLDAVLADEMAKRHFELVARVFFKLLTISNSAQDVRVRAPLGKTALLFAEPERRIDGQRVETSWRIAGGFLLAHRVNYGGRFYLGAEWQADGELKVYSAIRRYPPRFINWFGVPQGITIFQRTQGAIHQLIQAKYLREIAAWLAPPGGTPSRTRTVILL